MIVLKFGGTSVGNASMMERTLDIVQDYLPHSPLLVSSAMTKMTDLLLHICSLAEQGLVQEAFASLEQCIEHHRSTAVALLLTEERAACLERISALGSELHSLVKGLCLIREVSPRSKDAVVSFGERLSTILLYHKARERGTAAEWIDARHFVKTDDNFGSANLLKNETYAAIAAGLKPSKNRLIITQGFIGSTLDGITSTLGRGGSDWSATIFGAALKAERVEIWTDVDGIMTTDPRIVPNAEVIPEISAIEAAELAFFGAKVIHPATILPAVELDIPVWVKNTKNPPARGTCITTEGAAPKYNHTIHAIAGKKNITMITVRSTRMLNAYGFLRSIFQAFENHRVSVDLVGTSEVSVSMTVDDTKSLPLVVKELEAFSEVEVEDKLAIVCLVGRGIRGNGATLSRIFLALQEIPMRLVTMGSSETNISFVVPQSRLDDAIRSLHNELFPPSN